MKLPLGFRIIDNLTNECSDFIDCLEHQRWSQSLVFNDSREQVVSESRTSDTTTVPFIGYGLPDVISRVNKAVFHEMDAYAHDWNFGFHDVQPVSIQRYAAETQQHYDVHIDAGAGAPRILSALLYLNDCEGGETYFPHFEFKIQPKEGRLALFPSNFIYAHAAQPPTSGVKYAAAYWALG